MKTLRKIVFYLFITAATLLIALVVSVFLFKDKILNQFVREANKQLNTPVKIGKMDVSVFESFPQLSIVLTNVYVEDSHPGIYPLLTAGHVSFQLNAWEVWSGVYTIKGLQVRDSETNLKINAKGVNNYNITKEKSGDGAGATLSLALKNVKLSNTRVHYLDLSSGEDLDFNSEDLLASIEASGDLYNIQAKGELTSSLHISDKTYLTGKSFRINSDLVYDDAARSVSIKPSALNLK